MWVKLTTCDRGPLYVNLRHCSAVRAWACEVPDPSPCYAGGHAIVNLPFESFIVKETPEHIMAMAWVKGEDDAE